MGIKSKRVKFTFDPSSVKTLEDLAQEGGFNDIHDSVGRSLPITSARRVLEIRQSDGSFKSVSMPPRLKL